MGVKTRKITSFKICLIAITALKAYIKIIPNPAHLNLMRNCTDVNSTTIRGS